ncbi:GPP34 family phosphoprotein [Streptomyces sp. NBC_00663]|uniref:GOLPH3/VPS74 family protein n=1 Tax=Streptomyces sp. NBC_00663 TaxID=2975801 RepID=UPI002E307C3A|nr:GPP34 family phosphoprotein [Streptomyces sp. NBC_00663]
MDITLGEQLLLLSLDDESGAERESAKVAWAIAAATLVELALAGRVEVGDDQRVVVIDPTPPGTPGLDAALAEIVAWDKPGRVKDWLTHLKKDAVAAASRGLLDRGLVREEVKKVLGLFPVRRYPEADPTAETALRERLEDAVLRGATPDPRTASLVALLHGARLHRLAFPTVKPAEVDAPMAALATGDWAAPAVRRAIDSAQATLTTIVTTTVIGATVAGN